MVKFAKLAVILRIGETLRTSERTNDSLGGRRRSETEADADALGLGHDRARAREGTLEGSSLTPLSASPLLPIEMDTQSLAHSLG